jgi:hypothetical protein
MAEEKVKLEKMKAEEKAKAEKVVKAEEKAKADEKVKADKVQVFVLDAPHMREHHTVVSDESLRL